MVRKLGSFSLAFLAILFTALFGNAQVESGRHARPRVTQSVNESNRVALKGNTRPEASPANDRGAVANDFVMEHMLLQLKRTPEQEQALQQFIDELNTKGSPNFHRWLTAEEFGERFGLAKPDLDAITGWLESHGLRVNVVYPSGMLIDFSGTAAQVRKAFQTEIHHLEVKGERHVGNIGDPRIPDALAPVVAGVVSLHDFRPHAMHHMRKANTNFTFPDPYGGTAYALVPADLATIYNLNPLFSAGISGQGQTIVLIEDTDVFSSSDWTAFRQNLGLSGYTSASFTQVHPPAPPSMPGNNCTAPGVFAPNDAEAILDAEWASASAPNAAIEMAACADTGTTFGGLIALQNLINATSPPPSIVSISYGECETVNGAAANAAYNSAYQQAAAEGVSVFVAAGDSGAAGCDNSVAVATHGIAVNAFASTPNNVAVGGTDFSDTFSGTNTTYWNSANTPAFGSAISYIPEIPWNDSCAGALLSAYESYSPTYGATSLCNDPTLGAFLQSTVAGGGGPSQCASGTPSTSGVVSGSCAGWPKPSWQSVLGNPSDGVRDTPDVSLFAADGLWSHYYVFCWSDTANGGSACGSDPSAWSGAGGTSFASPIMAGIQALINQKAGGPQGNPAPVYYQLAAAEYGLSGNNSCNSSNGNAVASNCVFYDVTLGDMDVDCVGPNCFLGNGSVGVLSTSNTSFAPAYGTTVGWDFATGIGTINAANLVNNWPASTPQPGFTLSALPASLTLLQGAAGSTTIKVNTLNGFTGSVSLNASGLPGGVSASFGTNPATATSLLTLSASGSAVIGTYSVTIAGTSGSVSNKATVTLTVNPSGNYTLSASPGSLSIVQGAKGTSTLTVTPQSGFNSSVTLSASGLPSGVTAAFNPGSTTSTSALALTASSTAATGLATVTITGTSGNLSHTTTISLTVTAAPPNFALSASPSSLSIVQGTKGTSAITVTPQGSFNSSVNFSASNLPGGVTASFNPSSSKASSTLTLTASSSASTGTFSISIRGVSGSLSHTITISLTVTAPLPNFTLSASPSSLSITQGASGASTVTITPQNGFSSSVNLSVSGLPSGVTASFNTNPATSASTLTLTANSTATTGTATITITGTSGSLTHSTTVALTVTLPPNFALSASPASLSVMQGAFGTSTITVTPQNGFSNSVTLTASGLPSGVTASFNTNPATATSTLTLTAGSTATTGSATVTITGTSTTLTHTATIALIVTLAPNFPPGWQDLDIGSVGLAGSASYANGVFTVNGAGTSTWGTADGINFTYQPLSADGSIVARVLTVSPSTTGGVMIRDSLNASAMSMFVSFYGSSIYSSYRTTTGGSTSQASSGSVTLPYWVKVVRSSSTLSSYSSLDGVNWVQVGSNQTINMGQNVYVGLGVSSGNTASVATSTFDSVSINSTAAPAPVITSVAPNTGAIGTQAVISGTGFGTSQSGSTVTLNGAPVTINTWGNTLLSITIPSGAVSGPLVVSVAPSMNASNPVAFTVTAQPLPAGWLDQDVGQVGVAGSATYANGTFTVNGAGTSAWGTADGVNFMYQPLSGDGTIVARVVSVSPSSTGGVMIRETLNAGSAEMFSTYYSQNIYMNYRTSTGGSTSQTIGGGATLPYWVKVVRSGSTLSGYSSFDGVNWLQLGTSQTIPMAQNVYIGLAVSSGSTSTLATATFDNVAITTNPAPSPNFTLSAAPSGLTITQGTSGTSTITVTPQNGFASSVNFSASGLPSGVTASFSPNPATSTSTLTLTASSTALTGSATITIIGNSGSLTSATTISLTVTATAVPNFVLSASPTSLSVMQGTFGTSTITITPLNGFNSGVSLSVSGLPSGITTSFSANPATTSSILTLTASSNATTGTVPVMISGTSGSLTNTTTISLTVTAATVAILPPNWQDLDIGSVGLAGSASYANGIFTVNGAGTSTWGTADGINFTYQPLSADGSIVARVLTVSPSTTGGVMIRDSLNASAMSMFVSFYGSSIYSSYRTTTGGSTSQASSGSVTLPYWVKVVRSSSTLSSYSSLDGVNWVQVGSNQTINMGQNVYVGLGVSSGNTASVATSTFDSVSINSTAAPAPVITSVAPNTGAIGTQAVISGTGFGTSQSGSTVTLNGAPVTINTWGNTLLSITIPSGAVSGPLVVSVAPSMNASNPVAFTVTAQPLPAGWLDQDVGQVGVAGSATYANGTFTVNGAGTSAWGTADGVNFMYQPLSGDGTIVARVVSVSPSSTGGVMIRETLNAGSAEMFSTYYSQNIYMNYRTSTGGSTSQTIGGGATLPYWVKVVRSGSTLSGYSSFDGVNWLQLGTSQTIPMAQNVYIGLAVSSGSTSTLATATFDNVAIQ